MEQNDKKERYDIVLFAKQLFEIDGFKELIQASQINHQKSKTITSDYSQQLPQKKQD
uniref:Uncharacterized protein n=1 Tax=viral metagenome TaxID=1070528 RepID=A0A6M3XY03_9ZZZZ